MISLQNVQVLIDFIISSVLDENMLSYLESNNVYNCKTELTDQFFKLYIHIGINSKISRKHFH